MSIVYIKRTYSRQYLVWIEISSIKLVIRRTLFVGSKEHCLAKKLLNYQMFVMMELLWQIGGILGNFRLFSKRWRILFLLTNIRIIKIISKFNVIFILSLFYDNFTASSHLTKTLRVNSIPTIFHVTSINFSFLKYQSFNLRSHPWCIFLPDWDNFIRHKILENVHNTLSQKNYSVTSI